MSRQGARLLLFGALAVLVSGLVWAQVEPTPVPDSTPGGVTGLPNVTLPAPVVAILATSFAVALYIYKLLDGLKGFVPAIRDNPKLLKLLNIAGNILVLVIGCMALSHEHKVFEIVWCVVLGLSGAVITEGLRQSKKESDLARAADSVPQFKAAQETEATANARDFKK